MRIIQKLLLNDRFILGLILVNAVVIFLQGFHFPKETIISLSHADNIITIIFIFELIVKLKNFVKSNWNIFDTVLILLAFPSLLLWVANINSFQLDYLLVFRVTRIFKFFRFLRFFPEINQLINGVQRALKASAIIIFGFFIFIFIISIVSCFLYRNIAPEYFEDPFVSLYSVFKIFTVEGWFEVPEAIAKNTTDAIAALTKMYFVVILLTGGIFGLSIVNSIFVDAMVSDNNDDLEKKVNSLEKKIDKLIENNLKQ